MQAPVRLNELPERDVVGNGGVAQLFAAAPIGFEVLGILLTVPVLK